MTDWKIHTPAGMNDIMGEECAKKREVENTLWSVFASFGYMEVETPMFEYYDVYAYKNGQISRGLEQESMFKSFDSNGRILTLRPEITASIARMAATKTIGEELPLRFCYTGNVFRAEKAYGARQREFTQSGIELIGASGPLADAEVVAAAIEALIAVGITDFRFEIGQVAFFNGLVEQAGLEPEQIEALRKRIDNKDRFGIRKITDTLSIPEKIKELMIELPFLFGDASVLDKANIEGLNKVSADALLNIRTIYDILISYGFEKFVSVDLGMLSSIDYYTGSIFKCYAKGIGFPVCAGGRYDNLVGKFGRDLDAVGIAFGVNNILSVIREKDEDDKKAFVPRTVVYAEEGAEALCYDLSYNLRINGCMVEGYVGEKDYKKAEEYSKKTSAECMIRVFADSKMMIKDFKKGEIIETTINDFLDYYEEDDFEDDCGCGHDHSHSEDCECGHCH